MKAKRDVGISEETYRHISENIHLLDLDLKNGLILNRESKRLSCYGYYRTGLSGKTVLQHHVFAVARWGSECIGMTVNHINECRTDNTWNNLELLKHEDNVRAKTKLSGSCLPKRPVKAINIDTGDEFLFESVREAGRQLNVVTASISKVLNGQRNRVGRYTFKLVLDQK